MRIVVKYPRIVNALRSHIGVYQMAVRNAFNVRSSPELDDDLELIAEYLKSKGDVSLIWGERVTKTTAATYAIQAFARSLRNKKHKQTFKK